jgi:8-oxo-dGTP diphosphatase
MRAAAGEPANRIPDPMADRGSIHVLARALVVDGNRILLKERLDAGLPYFYLPGGHIEPGETAAAALVREFREETGLAVVCGDFAGCLECLFRPRRPKCHDHEYNLVFWAEFAEPPEDPPPQLEAGVRHRWLPLEDLGGLDLRPEHLLACLPLWLGRREQGAFQSVRETGA